MVWGKQIRGSHLMRGRGTLLSYLRSYTLVLFEAPICHAATLSSPHDPSPKHPCRPKRAPSPSTCLKSPHCVRCSHRSPAKLPVSKPWALTSRAPPRSVDCRIVFWQPSANIGDAVPFQITLASPPGSTSAGLAFSSVAFQFSDGRAPVVVRGTDSSEDGEGVCRLGALGEATGVRSGAEEATGKLSWPDGAAKVFSGTIAGGSESALTVSFHFAFRAFSVREELTFWRLG